MNIGIIKIPVVTYYFGTVTSFKCAIRSIEKESLTPSPKLQHVLTYIQYYYNWQQNLIL